MKIRWERIILFAIVAHFDSFNDSFAYPKKNPDTWRIAPTHGITFWKTQIMLE